MRKLNDYDVIAVILVGGVQQFLIRTPGGASSVSEWEFRKIWGREHPEHWFGGRKTAT